MSTITAKCPFCHNAFALDKYAECDCKNFYITENAYKNGKKYYTDDIKGLHEKLRGDNADNAKLAIWRAWYYEEALVPLLKLLIHLQELGGIVTHITKNSRGNIVIRVYRRNELIVKLFDNSLSLIINELKYMRQRNHFNLVIDKEGLLKFPFSV